MGSFFLEPRKSFKILIFSSLWHHWILSRWCSFPPPRWAEGNSAARDDIMRWSNVKNGTVAIDPVPPKIIKHIWYYKMIQETLIQCLATEMHIILHNLYLNWIYSDLWYISLTYQTSSRWNMVNQPVHMPGIFRRPILTLLLDRFRAPRKKDSMRLQPGGDETLGLWGVYECYFFTKNEGHFLKFLKDCLTKNLSNSRAGINVT